MSAPAANDYVAWRDVPSLVAASDALSNAGALNTALRQLVGFAGFTAELDLELGAANGGECKQS